MAVDMAIKFEGGNSAEGESKAFDKQVDVLAWSWGMSQSGTMHTATGGGAGKVNVQDLSFTKYVDKASPKLQLACCDGTHYDKATLTVRKAGGKQEEYLKVTMEELIVTSVSTGGSGGEDRLTENVSLNFAKVKVEYFSQDAKGKVAPAGDYTWNIATNTK